MYYQHAREFIKAERLRHRRFRYDAGVHRNLVVAFSKVDFAEPGASGYMLEKSSMLGRG
jgi:hypothetical protein